VPPAAALIVCFAGCGVVRAGIHIYFPFFFGGFLTPETLSRFGFARFAFAEALRAPAAMIALPRAFETPALLAALDAAASKPIPLRDFAICSSVQLRPHVRQPLVVLLDAVERLRLRQPLPDDPAVLVALQNDGADDHLQQFQHQVE